MVIRSRKWIPTVAGAPVAQARTITFYDCGDIWGELIMDTWQCWKVVKREFDGKEVTETLERLEEYIPWNVNSMEIYPLLNYTNTTIEIPGWQIVFL
jgi:hypothetical protein